jgi:hypothetical protein
MSIAKDIVERLKVNPEHYGTEGGVSFNKDKSKKDSKGCC